MIMSPGPGWCRGGAWHYGPMTQLRILALIQAGGKGGRMDVLTREVAKPVLPFAGAFRLIDFPLSNLRNSGIADVWLSVQYLGRTIADAVGGGKPWDLDRHVGGFRLVMPEEGTGAPAEEGFASGNAEELYQGRDAIRAFEADAVIVLSADHVYRLDYSEVVRTHLDRGAECTIVTTSLPMAEVSNHATVIADDDHRVTGFAYKPEEPETSTVATEVFVYDPTVLIELLEELQRDLSAAGEPDGLGDFGEHLVPALVERGKVFAHPLPGYWRDLGRPEAYLAAHRELLTQDTGLFEPEWPITSNQPRRAPASLRDGSAAVDAMISDGSVVHGSVQRSVLGPGVVVRPGALVRDSVIFADVIIEEDARIDWSIIDSGTVIGAGAEIGAANPDEVQDPEYVTLIGRDARIRAGATVERGARIEPGTT